MLGWVIGIHSTLSIQSFLVKGNLYILVDVINQNLFQIIEHKYGLLH